ncbi:hypothetical protein KCU62_g235, partial [Aureobasidium sp. EXF-3399]
MPIRIPILPPILLLYAVAMLMMVISEGGIEHQMKRVRKPDSIGGVFTMPLLRSFMPDVFGLSGRSPPAAACSRSLRAAFCACFLMSLLSRAVCRGGPLADAGAGEDGFCELNLSLMVGLGRVSGRGSPFLSGCELEGSEGSDLTDSEESLWAAVFFGAHELIDGSIDIAFAFFEGAFDGRGARLDSDFGRARQRYGLTSGARDHVGKVSLVDLDVDVVGGAKSRNLHVVTICATFCHPAQVVLKGVVYVGLGGSSSDG